MVRLQRLRPPPGADREINVTEGEYAKMAQFHFEHEEMSIQMVKMLFERNGIVISRYLEQEGDANRASDAQHIHFVCQLIRGIKDDAPWPEEATGRPAAKRFLADIVSNSRSGIDVERQYHKCVVGAAGSDSVCRHGAGVDRPIMHILQHRELDPLGRVTYRSFGPDPHTQIRAAGHDPPRSS